MDKLSIAILLYMDSIAIRIRESRKAKGLSQKQLADAIGVTPSAISQYEIKSGTEPSLKNLSKIAKALDVSFEWLATGRGVKGIEETLIKITEHYKDDERLVLLTDRQQKLFDAFIELPEIWQDNFISLIELKALEQKKI